MQVLLHAVLVHIYSSIHASIHSSIHLNASLNASISFVQIYPSWAVLVSIHPSIHHLSICPSIRPSISCGFCSHLSISCSADSHHPSIHQSINQPTFHLSNHPCIHPSLSLVQLLFTYFSSVYFPSDRFIYALCLLLSLGGEQSPMCWSFFFTPPAWRLAFTSLERKREVNYAQPCNAINYRANSK